MISISAHHKNVRSLPCVVSRRPDVTLHHVHGGSCIEMWGGGMRGTGQKTSDYLVIPIHTEFHTGRYGIDYAMSVQEWEARFGSQVYFLLRVQEGLMYDLFDLAGVPSPPPDLPRFPLYSDSNMT